MSSRIDINFFFVVVVLFVCLFLRNGSQKCTTGLRGDGDVCLRVRVKSHKVSSAQLRHSLLKYE